jgi:lipopolysaccharide export system permease protein
VAQLTHSIDSVRKVSLKRSAEQSEKLISERYFGRETKKNDLPLPTELTQEERKMFNLDSLWAKLGPEQRYRVMQIAQEKARVYRDQVEYNAIMLEDANRYIRKHEIELYRKFTLAFACLVFFFIGAPLGAIIRKGGLGAPVVISVILFIIYYIIDNTGYKMAREALWPCWAGMWLSSFVLLPIGIFLTYKAATDSPLFNPEAWVIAFKKGKERVLQLRHQWLGR